MRPASITLVGVSPPLEGLQWRSDALLRVGRLDTLEIYLNDPSISRRHAEVLATDEGWVVHDLGSTNGTFVNGVRVGRANRRLRPNDLLQCGNLALLVTHLEEDVPDRPRPAGPSALVESASRRSWEQALEALEGRQEPPRPQCHHLLNLLRSGYHLCHSATVDELLLSVLEDVV